MKCNSSFLIGFIIIFLFSTCADTKKTDTENSETLTHTSPPDQVIDNPDNEPNSEPSNIINLETTAPPNETNSPPRNLGKRSLFALSPQKRTMAEDFKIGLLQDIFQDQIEFLKATWNLKEFLEVLIQKQIKKELLASEMSKELERFLVFQIKREYIPTKYRIGKAYFDENQEIRINLRLFKNLTGVSEGEVYLKKENEQWLISDMQISFSLLAEKYKTDNEIFMPSSYHWLLQE